MKNLSNTTVISLTDIYQQYDVQKLKEMLIAQAGFVCLLVPCPSFDFPRWNIDIADDYLAALYVGETLAQFCPSLSVQSENRRGLLFVFRVVEVIDIDNFTSAVISLSKGFQPDEVEELNDYGENAEYEEFRRELMDFTETLDERHLALPELGDKYMANYVVGINQVSDGEEMERMYFRYPERRYEFWRSFASTHLSYNLYVSEWAWIILHDLDKVEICRSVTEPLMKFGGFATGLPTLYEAQWISIGNIPPIVINNHTMASFPVKGIKEAQECAAQIWQTILQTKRDFQNKEAASTIHQLTQSGYLSPKNNISVKLSEDGYIMIATDLMAHYIFFQEVRQEYEYPGGTLGNRNSFLENISEDGRTLWKIPDKEQTPFWTALDAFSEALGKLEGNPAQVSLDWKKLDDEAFEQLCYDIISQIEQFDPSTIRKMGKSRSRDGGRDIEVFTRARLNKPAQKWIIQCKLLVPEKSLPASKLVFAEMLVQHGAKGYCVMTNAVIDSTLHDRLEGTARNLDIEIDEWDGLRIERILAKPRLRNIRVRHFGK